MRQGGAVLESGRLTLSASSQGPLDRIGGWRSVCADGGFRSGTSRAEDPPPPKRATSNRS